jgi:hypothetical protein
MKPMTILLSFLVGGVECGFSAIIEYCRGISEKNNKNINTI